MEKDHPGTGSELLTFGNLHLPEETTDHPLVTFALFAYNQEQVIQEAVEGALSQTYSPLEIILSDDCSTDKTYRIMKEMAEAYNGPHRVTVIKNSVNLGINAHVFSIDYKAKGEIIVHAAGDDVSFPERTERIVRGYFDCKAKPCLIMSNSKVIDSDGEPLGLFQDPSIFSTQKKFSPVDFASIGSAATYAISRQLIDSFPPPNQNLYGEDKILLARANLVTGILYLDSILVKYRVHEGGVWTSNFLLGLSEKDLLRRHAKRAEDYLNILNQVDADMAYIGYAPTNSLKHEIHSARQSFQNLVRITKGSFVLSFIGLLREMTLGKQRVSIFKVFLLRWIPFARQLKIRIQPDSAAYSLHPAVGYPNSKDLQANKPKTNNQAV